MSVLSLTAVNYSPDLGQQARVSSPGLLIVRPQATSTGRLTMMSGPVFCHLEVFQARLRSSPKREGAHKRAAISCSPHGRIVVRDGCLRGMKPSS